MAHIVVITGSARPNSVNSKVTKAVVDALESKEGVTVAVADLVALELPFMAGEMAPSQPDYTITEPRVKEWADMVAGADGVVFVSPEYNHSMSGIQKNAIDWLYKEWNDKPAAMIAYGAYTGKHVIENFKEVNSVIKTKLSDEAVAGLLLGEDLAWDGSIADKETVATRIDSALNELLRTIAG